MTPIERATGQRPNLKHVLVFGTAVWVKVKNAGKLDPQGIEGHFVGYDEESKGYRVYFPRRRLVIVERDVFFDKNNVVEGEVAFEGETERPRSISNTTVPNNNATSASDNNNATDNNKAENIPPIVLPDEPQSSEPRRNSLEGLPQYDPDQYGRGKSRRTATKTSIDEAALAIVERDEDNEPADAICFHDVVLSAISEDQPPIADAINGSDSRDWKAAIDAELAQIEKLGTWELVEVPDNANIIPCCWVLHRKRNTQGKISCYKARLVAKGFRQQFGVDYTDMFAPTVRPATLRILLAMGAANGDNIIIREWHG
jgi:hypothetical protein